MLANAAVSWESRKQRTVALSTTEAEYMAISDAAKEAVNLKLKETLGTQDVVVLFNDNQGAGDLNRNPVFRNRTKHVDIRHNFIRELVENNEVIVEYIPTEKMRANVLTKGLSTSKHNECILI